ncbi:uncharacterized protein F4812DRAFT_460836 [Daldinia caldariorum]|uniref:uncharacterized protein n=1 Tax=Daldinia caldariorum TaxID=326644 RepID=UPI00200781AF|nr:uncharacterized protein F4812DRAFT_460836 [Daldinia caldariorum]KAI1466567.1 hypothetical protein F4812DRAFT_460836 [Daldinia caldariorum]
MAVTSSRSSNTWPYHRLHCIFGAFAQGDRELSPESDGPGSTRPDDELLETNEEFECCGCKETGHFLYNADGESMSCKECGHNKCDNCVET